MAALRTVVAATVAILSAADQTQNSGHLHRGPAPAPQPACQTDTFQSTCKIQDPDDKDREPIFECPSSDFIGKWAVYAVPCSQPHTHLFYQVDSGWGGAHITLAEFDHFEGMKARNAFDDFKQKWYANKMSAGNWRPGQGSTGFTAEQHTSGWRGMGITSNMLDAIDDTLGHTQFRPKAKGDWHITLASETDKKFSSNDVAFENMKKAVHGIPWSLVLVQISKECSRGQGCKMVFHRKDGFYVGQRDVTSESNSVENVMV